MVDHAEQEAAANEEPVLNERWDRFWVSTLARVYADERKLNSSDYGELRCACAMTGMRFLGEF